MNDYFIALFSPRAKLGVANNHDDLRLLQRLAPLLTFLEAKSDCPCLRNPGARRSLTGGHGSLFTFALIIKVSGHGWMVIAQAFLSTVNFSSLACIARHGGLATIYDGS